MEYFDLYFNLLFIILLSCMIFYSIRLNKQLKAFAESRDDFQSMMKDLNNTFGEADNNIKGFQSLTSDSHRELDEKISLAISLADELKFMIESADHIATRLEHATENTKSRNAAASSNISAASASATLPEQYAPEVDYYKSSNPASTAARREAAMSYQSRTNANVAFRDRTPVGSAGVQSKVEKDILNVMKVKAR